MKAPVAQWIEQPPDYAVDVFEAESTHALNQGAMADYIQFYAALDANYIDLTLYIVSRYGHINPIDLHEFYLQTLSDPAINPSSESLLHMPSDEA